MGPRPSPSKRKRGEVALGGKQRRLSEFGGTQTKPGLMPIRSAKKAVPRELVMLGLSGEPAANRRITRGGLADQQRTLRSASIVQQQPSPVAKPATGSKKRPVAAKQGGQPPRAAAAAGAPASGRRCQLSRVTIDDETFRLGDDAYVVLDTALMVDLRDDDDDCACLVCGSCDMGAGRVMLECDRCLAGCHLACLTPPLADVPEGEWLCPGCASGAAPPRRPPRTARDCLLQRHGLALARIESIWQEGDGEAHCTYRWYCLPEETHTGRQRHHLAREVFLTQQRDDDSADALLRAAHVLPPHEFGAGPASSQLGEDVYLCEYLYDSAWQRFRRRTEFEGDSDGEEGEEWAPGGDAQASESEGEEELCAEGSPAAKGSGGRRAASGGNGSGINRRKQGGEQWLARVGALAVPEHARLRRRDAGAAGALCQARSVLALAAVPRLLPCRDGERNQVADFVKEVLHEEAGKCLYISGIPGTGKTATVLEVMRGLKRKSETGELPPFQFVEINGLRLPSPQHAYSALYEALTGDRAGPATAAAALEQMFGGGGKAAARRPTIVLVDEMDLLVNKTQTVLYNLFDWPGRKASRLSIIGVANTMDLPERLHPRIGSRLAGRRVVFQPYTKEQLQEIIKSRLEGLAAFKPNALEFISRKVANCSGDVRRCLELCRRAAEIAEEKLRKQHQAQAAPTADGAAAQQQQQQQQPVESGMVEMRHVAVAIAEMFNTGHVRLLRDACRLERLLLAAIHLETSSSGRAECLLADAWERLRLLCSQNCEAQQYDFGTVLERALELGAKRLIICDPGVRRVRVKVALNVATNDLLLVLTGDADLPWLAQALSRAAHAPVTGAE